MLYICCKEMTEFGHTYTVWWGCITILLFLFLFFLWGGWRNLYCRYFQLNILHVSLVLTFNILVVYFCHTCTCRCTCHHYRPN